MKGGYLDLNKPILVMSKDIFETKYPNVYNSLDKNGNFSGMKIIDHIEGGIITFTDGVTEWGLGKLERLFPSINQSERIFNGLLMEVLQEQFSKGNINNKKT